MAQCANVQLKSCVTRKLTMACC